MTGIAAAAGFVLSRSGDIERAWFWRRWRTTKQELGVRRLSPEQVHTLRQLIERLDRVSRAMNPLLLFIAASLVALNLACVLSLIDWRNLPQPPADVTTTAAGAAPANPPTPATSRPASH